jgi:hypothetical protein
VGNLVGSDDSRNVDRGRCVKVFDPGEREKIFMGFGNACGGAGQPSERAAYAVWTRIVDKYTSMSLGVHSDKLVAIVGLARRFRTVLQDNKYLAGLWLSGMPVQLMWYSGVDPCTCASECPVSGAFLVLGLGRRRRLQR